MDSLPVGYIGKCYFIFLDYFHFKLWGPNLQLIFFVNFLTFFFLKKNFTVKKMKFFFLQQETYSFE